MSLSIGPTVYSKGGVVKFGKYASGEIALQIINPHTGEPELTATSSLVPYGAPRPGPYEIYIKDYSENEGVEAALIEAEIIILTEDDPIVLGHSVFFRAVLTEKAQQELQQQLYAQNKREMYEYIFLGRK